jgi:hypothetical protein
MLRKLALQGVCVAGIVLGVLGGPSTQTPDPFVGSAQAWTYRYSVHWTARYYRAPVAAPVVVVPRPVYTPAVVPMRSVGVVRWYAR